MTSRRNWIFVVPAVAFTLTFAPSVFADDTDQSPSLSNATQGTLQNPPGSNNTPGAAAVDDMITNNNLRALSGSLSKWSIASQLEYLGGSVTNPLAEDRPDISAASGTTAKSDVDGSVSVKYNINGKNSLLAGVGLRWIAPLSVSGPSNYNGTVFDVMNPYLEYQLVSKMWGVQSVTQVQNMLWTQTDQTALGYADQASVTQEWVYAVPKTKLSVGVTTWGDYQWFNKSGSFGTPGSSSFIPDLAADQSVWAFGIDPLVEYQLSAKVNLRTLISPWAYEHYASAVGSFDLIHDNVYQSVGVGISITRDIFLYPNVQFLPLQFAWDETNVGVQATINVF